MRLKLIILNAAAALALVLAPVPAMVGMAAADASACGHSPAAQQVLGGIDEQGKNCGDDKVNNLFGTIVNIMSIIVGVAATIVIIYAGFKYITSGGEQGRVANAKSTLLYALVGLAVAALSQLMIHFVLFQSTKV